MMEDERNKNNKRQRTSTSENPAAFVGGPTLVTTQRDGDQKNTNFNEINGWLAVSENQSDASCLTESCYTESFLDEV